MSEFVVHGIPGSPYVRGALLALEEKDAPWRLVPVSFDGSKSPEHLARHPFGRVPVLEHGDFRLYETQAIMRYVDRLLPTPPLIPADPRREARMNQLFGISDWYMARFAMSAICFPRLVAPLLGLPVDEVAIAASVPQARLTIDEIARLLGEQPFLTGDSLSLADLMLAAHIDFFAATEEAKPMLAANPALQEWHGRMRARPSMKATSFKALTERAAAA